MMNGCVWGPEPILLTPQQAQPCQPLRSSCQPRFLWSMKYLRHTERRRTQTAIYLRYRSRFSRTGVALSTQLHVGCGYLWAVVPAGLLLFPLLSRGTGLISLFVEPCWISAYRPLELSSEWTDVFDTLCDGEPPHPPPPTQPSNPLPHDVWRECSERFTEILCLGFFFLSPSST